MATGDFIEQHGWSPFTGSQTMQLFDLAQQDRLTRYGPPGLLARTAGGWVTSADLAPTDLSSWQEMIKAESGFPTGFPPAALAAEATASCSAI